MREQLDSLIDIHFRVIKNVRACNQLFNTHTHKCHPSYQFIKPLDLERWIMKKMGEWCNCELLPGIKQEITRTIRELDDMEIRKLT